MSSSKTDRDYYGEMEQKCDADEEESWISGEELITEDSTDEEEEKCKTKPSKQKGKKEPGHCGSKFGPKTTALPPIKRENVSMSSAASADVNFNDEQASWRPKRGSIKLSDLEGYQLVQMRENQVGNDLNSAGDGCQEDELYSNNLGGLNLEFLKDIELNDLHDILKKYLNEDELSDCDYLSENIQGVCQDARDFGGIYLDLVNRDPSLNEILVRMNSLDKILDEKTENADKFLSDGKSKLVAAKHVKVTKCYKNIHLSNPRKISRSVSSFASKNKQKLSVRTVKSANLPEINMDDNSKQIKLSADQTRRLEEMMADETYDDEEIKLNPGEGFTLSTENSLVMDSIDSKLKSIYASQSASQRMANIDMQSLHAELKDLKLFEENKLLQRIDSELEVLQQNKKNNSENSVSDDELNRLYQSLRSGSPNSEKDRTRANSSEIDNDEKKSPLDQIWKQSQSS